MTPIAGFIIAVIAGLVVRRGRRAALVVAVPWLIVLVYQSWYIASGRAISPPSTVTDFPSAIGYWLVQVIIVAPALGIAAQLGVFGSRRRGVDPGDLARRSWIASGLGVAVSVIVILCGFVWFRAAGRHGVCRPSQLGRKPAADRHPGDCAVLPDVRRARGGDDQGAARGQARRGRPAGAAVRDVVTAERHARWDARPGAALR